jgi:hypothetical protein
MDLGQLEADASDDAAVRRADITPEVGQRTSP